MKTDSRIKVADLLAELLKLVKNKETPSDPISNFAKYVHREEQFADNSFDSSVLNVGDWIIDTGATSHVCGHLSCFDTYSAPSHKHFIHFPDGTKKQVAYTGIVRISDKLTLNSVFYVTDFSVNLLSSNSGTRNTEEDLYIVHCVVFKPLVTSIVAVPNSCTVVVDCNDSLWHRRLGHAFMTAIKHIPECNISKESLELKCDIYPKAKQCRISFKPSESHTEALFDLVHLDVWGPYKTPSTTGCHYVLTILDDFSRSLWTYLIKYKDQVTTPLHNFSIMVETQFGVKIKVLRYDNGSEFVNLNCQNLCQRLGIIHQTSCVYTPQQNGRAESKHRHLLNVARALFFQASLPLKFWGNYILAAMYIVNRTPTHILGWITPYQALNGHPPTYTHLKTFGCLCFATNLNPHKSKFHKRAHKSIFLGYSMTQKGYKLNILFTSMDVIFYELIFPLAQGQSTECFECPLPTPPVDTDDNNTESLTVPSPSHVASPETAPIFQHNDVVTSSQQPT
ncbi:UNVERIFIED_CONTAM: hypothetical protein Sindi_2479800 [Sesamum indicum]